MAKSAGLAQDFFVEGYQLGGDVSNINEASSPRNLLEVPILNKSAMDRLNGQSSGVIDFGSWFNDATAQEHAALKGRVTTDVVMLWALGGAIGSVAASLDAKQINYDFTRGTDGSLAATVRGESTNGYPLEWMNLLTAGKITHSSAANGTSRDDASATTQGIRANVQIVDTDSGTPTIVIQDSANDSSFATILSFTAVAAGSEPVGERKQATGAVRRYLRVATTGSFSNCDFIVAYVRGTAVDDEDLSS
jgi:hypothetical protein